MMNFNLPVPQQPVPPLHRLTVTWWEEGSSLLSFNHSSFGKWRDLKASFMERKSPRPNILQARRWRLPGLGCSCWQVYAGPLMRLELGLKENAQMIIQINNCCLFFMNYRMMIWNILKLKLTTDLYNLKETGSSNGWDGLTCWKNEL